MRTGLRSWDRVEEILELRRGPRTQPDAAHLRSGAAPTDALPSDSAEAEDAAAASEPPPAAEAAARGESPGGHAPSGSCPLERWLLEVDPRGRLLRYLGTVRENFDAVHQITGTYVSAQRQPGRRRGQSGASRKMLDHQLFVDLGMENRDHQELVAAWFAAKLGAGYDEPPPPPPTAAPPPEDSGEEDRGAYCYWPQDVPREQQNRARRLMHSTVKSWYPRERVHGPPRRTQGLGAPVMLRLLRQGDGCTYPSPGDTVTVHYEGRLADGTKFDSSWDRREPLQFVIGVGRVIRGWDVGILRMSLGERSVVHVPSVLAYGEAGAGDSIPPLADLDFEVELLEVEPGNSEGLKVIAEDSYEGAMAAWGSGSNPCMQDD